MDLLWAMLDFRRAPYCATWSTESETRRADDGDAGYRSAEMKQTQRRGWALR